MIDKIIGNGQIEEIFTSVINLSQDGIDKFHSLLQKTDLEDVVHFANQVANKLEFLEFLHELIYGDISSVLKNCGCLVNPMVVHQSYGLTRNLVIF